MDWSTIGWMRKPLERSTFQGLPSFSGLLPIDDSSGGAACFHLTPAVCPDNATNGRCTKCQQEAGERSPCRVADGVEGFVDIRLHLVDRFFGLSFGILGRDVLLVCLFLDQIGHIAKVAANGAEEVSQARAGQIQDKHQNGGTDHEAVEERACFPRY